LCDAILSNGIDLSFVLAPYHPIVYEKIRQSYPMVLKVETMIMDFAKKKDIDVFGSFDPAKGGVGSQDFYDGMHCKGNAIMKILRVKSRNNVYKSLAEW
jgi:hypothetical protein